MESSFSTCWAQQWQVSIPSAQRASMGKEELDSSELNQKNSDGFIGVLLLVKLSVSITDMCMSCRKAHPVLSC